MSNEITSWWAKKEMCLVKMVRYVDHHEDPQNNCLLGNAANIIQMSESKDIDLAAFKYCKTFVRSPETDTISMYDGLSEDNGERLDDTHPIFKCISAMMEEVQSNTMCISLEYSICNVEWDFDNESMYYCEGNTYFIVRNGWHTLDHRYQTALEVRAHYLKHLDEYLKDESTSK